MNPPIIKSAPSFNSMPTRPPPCAVAAQTDMHASAGLSDDSSISKAIYAESYFVPVPSRHLPTPSPTFSNQAGPTPCNLTPYPLPKQWQQFWFAVPSNPTPALFSPCSGQPWEGGRRAGGEAGVRRGREGRRGSVVDGKKLTGRSCLTYHKQGRVSSSLQP